MFPGTPPLPTTYIEGIVYEAGGSPSTTQLDDVSIEVLDGLLKGRSVKSGLDPPVLPGFYPPPLGPGGFRLIGAPPGTHRLRFSKAGYVTQEQEATTDGAGMPYLSVALQRLP